MKISNYLLLLSVFVLIANCSAGLQANTTAGNSNSGNAAATRTPTENKAPATPAAAENKAPAEIGGPAELIRDLYKTHDKDNGAIIQGENRALIDKYFDKNLAGLIWKDLTTHKDEVGVIDFDVFYNAQDTDIKNLAVGEPKIEGDKATVAVTFENFKKKNTVTYSLVKEKENWKISDIDYGGGQTLLKMFKAAK